MFRNQSLIIIIGGIYPEVCFLCARLKDWGALVAGSTSRGIVFSQERHGCVPYVARPELRL